MSEFTRVSASRPCAICGQPDWCTVSNDGAVARCMRVADGCFKVDPHGGHCHNINGQAIPPHERTDTVPRIPIERCTALARRWYEGAHGKRVVLADQLGVKVEALESLRCGWADRGVLIELGTSCRGPGAYTFPMRDEKGQVIGISLRTEDGFKYATTGSRNGLFIPATITNERALIICEGASDCAALMSIGCNPIGRHSNVGGADLLAKYAHDYGHKRAYLLCDRDPDDSPALENTRNGAKQLVGWMRTVDVTCKVRRPPEPYKDARAWVASGATKEDVAALFKKSLAPQSTAR